MREALAGVAVGEVAALEVYEAEDTALACCRAFCISVLVEDAPASTPPAVELPESQPEAEAVHPDRLECHKAHEVDSESLNRLHHARTSRNVDSSGQ